MKIDVQPAWPEAIDHIAKNLSERDRAEIWAYSGKLPDEALAHSVGRSEECEVALFDGEPAAAFGCAPFGPNGSPWLLSTDRLREAPRHVLSVSQERVGRYARVYPALINFVHWKNMPSLRWLERLGFSIEPAKPAGLYGVPFHRIIRCVSQQHC